MLEWKGDAYFNAYFHDNLYHDKYGRTMNHANDPELREFLYSHLRKETKNEFWISGKANCNASKFEYILSVYYISVLL